MQTQRTAIRKNRKGNVLKVVSEHYLRDDILCGCTLCPTCDVQRASAPADDDTDDASTSISAAPGSKNPTVPHPRLDPTAAGFDADDAASSSPVALLQTYLAVHPELRGTPLAAALASARATTPLLLIPDHSVFSGQMDLLECGTAPFASVVILQSVLDEMRSRHYKTYQRMRALVKASGFEAATTLNQNFIAKSVSAAAGVGASAGGADGVKTPLAESTLTAHATVFANLHHRSTYLAPADAMRFIGAQPSAAAAAVKGEGEAMSDAAMPSASASEGSDSDDDLSSLPPLVKTIEHGSPEAAALASAKAVAATAQQEALVLAAGRWFAAHLGRRALPLVLTNSPSAAAAAQQLGVAAVTAAQLVAAVASVWPRLDDVLAKATRDEEARAERQDWEYAPHLTEEEMRAGVASGALLKGVFDVNRDYWSEGSVSIAGRGRVFVPSFHAMNRAIHGDTVVVRMLPQDQWRAPSTRLAPPEDTGAENDGGDVVGRYNVEGLSVSELQDENNLGGGGRMDADASAGADADADAEVPEIPEAGKPALGVMPTCEVVGVWSREVKPLCGVLEETDKTEGTVFFLPVNKRYPKIAITSRQIQDLLDKRVMVAFDAWPLSSRHPRGHLVRVLGTIGDHATETEVVLLEHEIKHDAWSKAVEACLPGPDYEIDDRERAGRVDLRDVNICSIDPPGCTDIDDALHCTRLADGTYEVGVHIADVTHYVKPGSALDVEAATRSTSVYLVDRRIDMIPARLSTNICSLHEKVERLAFSSVWRLNAKGEILETRFFKSVIRSRAAFTYAQAQARIDEPGDGGGDPLTEACKDLMMLARLIKAQRIAKGAVALASAEVKFVLDKESHLPTDVQMYQLKEANSLVEEFMLLANVSVAEQILRAFPTLALLRRHPTPPPEMLQPLVRAAKTWGFDVDISSGKSLNESLNKIVRPNDPIFNKVVRMLTTRCMTQAVYVSSGEISEKSCTHFGLAAQHYTHFTSPIRRYADVVAHRLLAASLGIAPLPDAIKDRAHMRDCVDNLNHRHRMAQLASRASTEVYSMLYFADKHVTEEAVIVAVKSTGVRVLVPKYGIECAVKIQPPAGAGAAASAAKLVHDPEKLTLTVGCAVFRILQRVQVSIQVKENKMRRRWMCVELVGDDKACLDAAFTGAPAPVTPSPAAAAAAKDKKKAGKKAAAMVDDDDAAVSGDDAVIDVAAELDAKKAARAAAAAGARKPKVTAAVGSVSVVRGVGANESSAAAELAAATAAELAHVAKKAKKASRK
jgi:exosome complex exonuclease DIS3/RRP44